MAEKPITDNDSLVSTIKMSLMLCSSYLTSARSFLQSAYGPSEYNELFRDRVDTVQKEIRNFKTTTDTNSSSMKNNAHYKDYDGVEGTWRYYG